MRVAEGVGVGVATNVGVTVAVGVGVLVTVGVGVTVAVGVAVNVGVGVTVIVGVPAKIGHPLPSLRHTNAVEAIGEGNVTVRSLLPGSVTRIANSNESRTRPSHMIPPAPSTPSNMQFFASMSGPPSEVIPSVKSNPTE